MSKTIAIHQPNFFPWLGYFEKIIRSDVFIFLDHVQFPKTGGIWSNRVKMLVGGQARWVTAPIVRSYHGVRTVCDMEFQPNNPWREKVLKTIVNNYSKAPYFNEAIEFFQPLILNEGNNLSRYNTNTVIAIAEKLGVSTEKFHWSSKLPYKGQANEMLISLTQAVGGDTYLCGGGAGDYQDEQIFKQSGVKLQYQGFSHPTYAQIGAPEFVPGLSVIDAVMNIGWIELKRLLRTMH